ncbi:MAG: hypothetical protein MI757_13535 [Pirellulales bacterium]|nr:hypothetical protein [Pirellulales bacterium]
MTTTVELSMYPFQDTFRELIKGFVAKLNEVENLQITTGPTSTVIVGEHVYVMQTLSELLEWSHNEHGKAVFVAKILPDYVAS